MKSKSLLTSIAAIAFALPAMAEPTTSGTFPTGENGYMQENYIYTNAATSTNMDGVYEGTVNATAYYDDIPYTINAGEYLPASAEAVATCTAGNYCPGLPSTVIYSTTTNQGLNECPTGYGNSAAGATAETDCYRQCSGNVTIAHATGVTGNDYYGNGTDTCEPTGCENGWHVKPGVDLTTTIGSEEATGLTANKGNGAVNDTVGSMSNSVISGEAMAFVMDYGNKGMIKGHGRCSTQNSVALTIVNNLTDETGQEGAENCYCQLDSYTSFDGTATALSGPWVFKYSSGSASWCSERCATACAYDLRTSSAFRNAIFGAYPAGLAQCEANTITINWGDVDPEYEGDNNEGTATYGEDIRTPFKAATKPGKRFKGWRFSAPNQNQGG